MLATAILQVLLHLLTTGFPMLLLHLIYHHATSTATLFPFNQIRHTGLQERLADIVIAAVLLLLPLPSILAHSRLWQYTCYCLRSFTLAEEWHTWKELYHWNPEKAWVATATAAIRLH
ncbi:hypothetical protein HGH93_07460 [Chitinophaga polysaccharea]|uniref:hypothetical protein n=1 Tax=Chitinophaga TaxID=79328 RepID=UPI0014554205|nr:MULTISPECIES: hypothetical protein [Chitinophaga]NLR57932.1 hypothetical protein [Chitinophaga polysaccharea]NLU93525.1 hypothetical protein [Chitinophaga sp. Ak27]